MRKDEVEMAEFLDSLRAPQSRRIIESLVVENLKLDALSKKTKLSIASIELHLKPLLHFGLVTLNSKKEYRINKSKFKRCLAWFTSIAKV
jgi:DNA-binding transcriptional ArsR family regulator